MKISLLVVFVATLFLLGGCTPSAPNTESVEETVASTKSIVNTVIVSEPIPETAAFTETIVVAEPTLEQPTIVPSLSSEESDSHNQDAPGLRELAVVPRPPDVYLTRNDAQSSAFSVEYVPISYYPSLDTDLVEYFASGLVFLQ